MTKRTPGKSGLLRSASRRRNCVRLGAPQEQADGVYDIRRSRLRGATTHDAIYASESFFGDVNFDAISWERALRRRTGAYAEHGCARSRGRAQNSVAAAAENHDQRNNNDPGAVIVKEVAKAVIHQKVLHRLIS